MAQTFEIHPSIGIARVGSSQEFFFGPTEPGATLPASFRDNTGKLKRQAARFRVFACTRASDGTLTAATEVDASTVTWRVRLVNRKAASPRFLGGGMRNGASGNEVTDRALILDSQSQPVKGVSQAPVTLGGAFRAMAVPLGDIRTDDKGRLVVCGGFGRSASSVAASPASLNFADNDDWFDDVSDGLIEASFVPAGSNAAVVARTARVIVGPPDFAPEIQNLVTLYDVALDVAITKTLRPMPAQISFTRHILSILLRASGYQWVNRRARSGHSGPRPGNFAADPAALADMQNAATRRLADETLRRLRDSRVSPIPNPVEPLPGRWMPRMHDEQNDSTHVLALTRFQYECLVRWRASDFVNDLASPPPAELLPDALDRMALESCSGGAFFPGIECGRIAKDPRSYDAAFHINDATVRVGDITAGNALPWQADFEACAMDDSGLAWWPAQRPDEIIPEAAQNTTRLWKPSSDPHMVDAWDKLGVVRQVGQRFVETERKL